MTVGRGLAIRAAVFVTIAGTVVAALLAPLPAFTAPLARPQQADTAVSHRLIANMHGLLFHEDAADLAEDVRYARWLGATTIRAFATDTNTARPWDGRQIGEQIIRLAPDLRSNNLELIVALVNNHEAVPGENPASWGWLDNHVQLLLPFYVDTWRGPYLRFVRDVISTVRDAHALDVIGAWELGNELHTPQDPLAVEAFVSQAAGEIRAVDADTPIWPGTMGANHLEPGVPSSAVARWLYCEAPIDAYTLHAYDWISDERWGDMPIQWDFESIVNQPCPDGRQLPVIVEELGTSRALAGTYSTDDEATRLSYELRQIRRVLGYRQLSGLGVWNAESPRILDRSFFDTRRGLTSYGAHALGGGSCYDPRPDPAPGTRCQLEEVLQQLGGIWPDPRPSAWLPLTGSTDQGDGIYGLVDPPDPAGSFSLSGWILDTRPFGAPGLRLVEAYAGGSSDGGALIGRGESVGDRPDVIDALGNPDWSAFGFRLPLTEAGLAAGPVPVTLVAQTADGARWIHRLTLLSTWQPVSVVAAAQPVIAPPVLEVTSPHPGITVLGGQVVEGVAYDPAATSDSGIDRIEVFLEPGRDAGGRMLGTARLGLPNPAVGAGSNRARAGFALVLQAPPGLHTLYLHARSSLSNRETVIQLPLRVR